MTVKICGGRYATEKEAKKAMVKWKLVARNPKVEESKNTPAWLVIVSEVEEDRADEAIHYFYGKGYECFILKKD